MGLGKIIHKTGEISASIVLGTFLTFNAVSFVTQFGYGVCASEWRRELAYKENAPFNNRDLAGDFRRRWRDDKRVKPDYKTITLLGKNLGYGLGRVADISHQAIKDL